jgi:hypothetical protein
MRSILEARINTYYRPVRSIAQFGSVPSWGGGGRGFKSRCSDCATHHHSGIATLQKEPAYIHYRTLEHSIGLVVTHKQNNRLR